MRKTTIIVLCLISAAFSAATIFSQPALYQEYICPSLKGHYSSGEKVTNADGESWTLSIQSGKSMYLHIPAWQDQYTVPSSSTHGFELYCVEHVDGGKVTATYSVQQVPNCQVSPEVAHPLFECY